MYSDDEMLPLSGIQHYRYCPRQWSLIHMESQWEENYLTITGRILHEHVDDPSYRNKSGGFLTLRGVHIASYRLGLVGIMDMLELHPAGKDDDEFIAHPEYTGKWLPFPVEYKRGRPKEHSADELQLTAQAICLEEMYGLSIKFGALFYGETRRRKEVTFSSELRDEVKECADQMHEIFKSGRLPLARKFKGCVSCSLKDCCLPEWSTLPDASLYLRESLFETDS